MEKVPVVFARDRRFAERHNVKTALRVRVWKAGLPEPRAESVNLSQRGIFFASNSRLAEGEVVEFLLKMPEEIIGQPTTDGDVPARRCVSNPATRPNAAG